MTTRSGCSNAEWVKLSQESLLVWPSSASGCKNCSMIWWRIRINQRASIVQLRSRLKLHLVPAFGSVRAAELSTAQVKSYTAERLRAGAANGTVNRELEIVERALKLATQCDPPKLVRQIHIPMLRENNVRTGFLEDDGYLRLKAELPDYLKPLLVVAYHVGNRLGELLKLHWSEVDFANNQIRPQSGQHQEQKVAPSQSMAICVSACLRRSLSAMRSTRNAVWFFTMLASRSWSSARPGLPPASARAARGCYFTT